MLAELTERRLQRFVAEQAGPDSLLFGARRQTASLGCGVHLGRNGYGFSLVPTGRSLIFYWEETFGLIRKPWARWQNGPGFAWEVRRMGHKRFRDWFSHVDALPAARRKEVAALLSDLPEGAASLAPPLPGGGSASAGAARRTGCLARLCRQPPPSARCNVFLIEPDLLSKGTWAATGLHLESGAKPPDRPEPTQ